MSDKIELTPFLSVDQVAGWLKVHRVTVRRWVRHGVEGVGKLPAVRAGRRYRIAADDVHRFMRDCRAARLETERHNEKVEELDASYRKLALGEPA